jgi:hypothetical protein
MVSRRFNSASFLTSGRFRSVTLKLPLFKRCTRIVPSYKKAKEIFDYCAQ